MELLISTSLIAAFVAGIAALLAPCCITVLLPSYLASVFREKRKVIFMTFIFFLGIVAIFLPLGLGAAWLGKLFSRFHNEIFIIGGILLIAIAATLFSGKHFSLPFKFVSPSLKNSNIASVFSLGVFSAIATTCCAPVLAGTIALSTLPGSLFWGGAYSISYVLGMTAPLFFIALFLDKINFTQKFIAARRSIVYSVGNKQISVSISELISGIIFLAMGILTIYLAFSNKLFIHSEYQTSVNIFLEKILNFIKI